MAGRPQRFGRNGSDIISSGEGSKGKVLEGRVQGKIREYWGSLAHLAPLNYIPPRLEQPSQSDKASGLS